MNKIAVLIACYNRKDKTLNCLEQLFLAAEHRNGLLLSVYLTDDGSSDGTSEAVRNKFPDKNIFIHRGSGHLYWAGGMRSSWKSALMENYDGYLLLNDDTYVLKELFDELLFMNEYSIKNYKNQGVYCGITCNIEQTKTTYGGNIIVSRLLYISNKLDPNGKIQECDLGNANIMYVPKTIVKKIGILSHKYTHAIADYDYTLRAKKNGFPVLVSSRYCGICERNESDFVKFFRSSKLKDRIQFLYSPKGLAFKDQLYYMRKHFPFRFPIYFIIGFFKTIFPGLYFKIKFRINKNYY